MRFRKKTIEVEAAMMPGWLIDAFNCGYAYFSSGSLRIQTLEGSMIVSPGDWIIRGVKGEIYPCKPDVFSMSYDLVDSENRGKE